MSERDQKQKTTSSNRPTLLKYIIPGTGSLIPDKDMDSSALETTRKADHSITSSIEILAAQILELMGNDPNFDKFTPEQIVNKTLYTIHKDVNIVFNNLNRLGIAEDIVEDARKQREAYEKPNPNSPSEKK